jgi:hypothetical protein
MAGAVPLITFTQVEVAHYSPLNLQRNEIGVCHESQNNSGRRSVNINVQTPF